ncbi:NADH dehydrogenase subunit L [Streptoalloteichus tenebrarius]|uniref:NADH dehydrogenase subunit L n=1 Tax=Streptoalloteichus tenebrarius (strain ATCC 17920 / DSM 40477 / JCM 4838 / CBS 697.72 / NBRC 16177 / NCIMB 11028 / NRRL B-12390 / A12253. 1 / ISP 5477) TaxID=1933 RepID=A0ABT1HXZ0_STRSD|nr:NADH-quinone oxidoreductase subunit L [Streptoalloteichus tenebrarius]MCP2260397.1 NADH dehydrogenase subunit L [Streptoalloteichus tenebrarius]
MILADGPATAVAEVGAATGVAQFAWLLVALPAFGAAVLLLGGRRTNAWGHLLGCLTVIAAFGYGLVLFLDSTGLPSAERVRELHLFSWIPVEALQVDFGLRLDPLSLVFVLLITGVGAAIHVYSIGYMAGDADRRKFFAYLNLFVAAMLVLVLGNSFVTLYLGWEGVGLASYLLIAFWHHRPEAATAAKKAFVMNRVGDVGLAIAIFMMFRTLGTTQYTEVFARAGEFSSGELLAITLLLLLGACGKSGQFPLQAWLPDAMAGPTPVSALIHAATMVTAGVYLVARANPLYDLSPDGRLVVTAIGAFTLLIGCVIGCAYDDFKKVLAYSTVSQIGYMILAVGLGSFGYALGIMHLLTHGFFKAGLFLGAGSVMHGMNDEGDIRRMGGLWRHMPITFVTWGLGYLALVGFPGLSGFFSKDAIIEAAFGQEGWRGWVFGGAALLGAGLTAFYMTRLLLMVFFGEKRWERLKSADGRDYHPHESPAVMTVPMILLAVGSVGAGVFLASGDRLATWLTPSLGALDKAEHGVLPHALVPVLTVALSALGALVAWLVVGRRPVPVERPRRVSLPVRAARADLYGNALNEALVARPGVWLSRALVYVDNKGVDGLVNGLAALLGGTSGRLRRLQTGFVRSYALSMLGGSVLVIAALMVVRFA